MKLVKSHNPNFRWVVLTVATVAQATACFLVQGLGAFAGYMQEALRLNAFEIGLLVSAAQLFPVIGLLVAGELLDRFNERLIVGVGSLIVAAALFGSSYATNYRELLAWLVIVGIGYSTAQPGGSKSVSEWFSKSQRGFAMGIRQAGLPLGGAIAAASLPLVAANYGWRAAFLAGSGVAFIGGILFIIVYRAPIVNTHNRRAVSIKAALHNRLSLLRHPSMRNILWSGITLITAQYGIVIFLVLYMHDRFNVSFENSANILFVAQCAGVVGRIALAAWSDRSKHGRYFPVLTSMGALILGLIMLLILSTKSLVILFILAAWLGFFGFGWYGPWVAYVSELAPPERTGFALGLAMAINQVAVILSPPLLGWLRDITGSYVTTWSLLIAILISSIIMTRPRKKLRIE
jgi:MFS family permease